MNIFPRYAHRRWRDGLAALFLALAALVALSGCTEYVSSSSRRPVKIDSAYFHMNPKPEAEALWRQAEGLENAGDYSGAIDLFEDVANKYSDNAIAPRALQRCAEIEAKRGDRENGLDYYNRLISRYSVWKDVETARIQRLPFLWDTGERDEAIQEATELWRSYKGPEDKQVDIGVFMATISRETGKIAGSLEWLEAAFSRAWSPEQRSRLVDITLKTLEGQSREQLLFLLEKGTSTFIRPFIEYRLAMLDLEQGRQAQGREGLRNLMAQNELHPLYERIRQDLMDRFPETLIPSKPDRLGCLVPLNGDYAVYGLQVLRGITLAVEEWNQRHPGSPVTLMARDTGSNQETAVAAFKQLFEEDGALAAIGPINPKSLQAMAPLVKDYGTPLVTLSRIDELTASLPAIFPFFLDNKDMVRSLVNYCRDNLGQTRFAVLYPDDRYGNRLSSIFKQVAAELSCEVTADVSYPPGSTDFRESIAALLGLKRITKTQNTVRRVPFQAIFVPDQAQTVALIAPQLPYYDVVGVPLIGTNIWDGQALLQMGGAYVEDALYVSPYFPGSLEPSVRGFRKRYGDSYDGEPSYLAAQSHDAMNFLLESRSRLNGEITRPALLKEMASAREFKGVTSAVHFDSQGAAKKDYYILQIDAGQLMQRWPEILLPEPAPLEEQPSGESDPSLTEPGTTEPGGTGQDGTEPAQTGMEGTAPGGESPPGPVSEAASPRRIKINPLSIKKFKEEAM